jgi:hypothetical protein
MESCLKISDVTCRKLIWVLFPCSSYWTMNFFFFLLTFFIGFGYVDVQVSISHDILWVAFVRKLYNLQVKSFLYFWPMLVIFGARKLAKEIFIKCWWNWQQADGGDFFRPKPEQAGAWVTGTQGEIWPKPLFQNSTTDYLIVHPKTFKILVSLNSYFVLQMN